MSESRPDTAAKWSDPDDSPEWTEAMFDAAEFSIGGKVVRAGKTKAMGTLTEHIRSRPRGIVGGVYPMAAGKETSPKAAKAASKTLRDDRTAKASKAAAGSALSQKPAAKGKGKK